MNNAQDNTDSILNQNSAKNIAIETAKSILGYPGVILHASKRNAKPSVVFNSNVCIRSAGKIWFGDVDIKKDAKSLTKLAMAFKEPVYVLKEMDGRFENEQYPLFDKAVAVFNP